jgi:hypothetical protein
MAIHSKADAIAFLDALSAKDYADGLYIDLPRKRRRAQAMGAKQIRVTLPKDLQARVGRQIDRFVRLLGKELGWTVIVLLLEYPSDKRLVALGEEEGREPSAQA